MAYHVPALLDESINGLNIRPDGIYIDVTFGGGGHSREILKHLGSGRLIAFDQDSDAAVNAPDDSRFMLLNQNFRFLRNNLRYIGVSSADGIIADLGVSFHQFDIPERGFSFRQDASLDMRMNLDASVTAASLLATLDEGRLADILFSYGELSNSRQLAKSIVKARNIKPIETVSDFNNAIGSLVPRKHENKFLAKLYQALRIAVNNEIEYLGEMLEQALTILRSGGRLVVITYHSLEDRIVKNFMKAGNFTGELTKDFYGNNITPFRLISRKPITPGSDEITRNSRSRSAKLRIAEKI